MALSYATYVGDGSTKSFSVPFPYLDKAHVHVRLGDDRMPSFTFTGDAMVSLAVPPAPGEQVRVFRSTPKAIPAVTFHNDQAVDVEHFNDAIRQALYVAQELEDLNGSVIYQYEMAVQTGSWWYDVSATVPYTPLKGEYVLVMPTVRQLAIPAGFAGSFAFATTSPTDRTQVFTILRDTVAIGALTFPAGSSTGTFSGGGVTLPVGSVLRIMLASEADSAFRDFGITIRTTSSDA